MKGFLPFCVFQGLTVGLVGLAADQSHKGQISFSTFAKLGSGAPTKNALTKQLGKPVAVAADSKQMGESWEYDGLTVFFEKQADAAHSWTWRVQEGFPEQNLKVAMSRFSGAKWEPETVKWINPHHFPNECFFKDKNLGISIEYNRARKEVFSIDRWDPTRELASKTSEDKPPQYCIGTACSPAISAKEFFKESPISEYCEIPK
jgi:hypothetical protein